MIAGGYSRHLPRPDCHPMEWRRIVMEELSGRAESCMNTGQIPLLNKSGLFLFFVERKFHSAPFHMGAVSLSRGGVC